LKKVARRIFLENCKLQRMKMPTLAANEARAKVEVKIRIIQEEEAVQEEEGETHLIKEISSAIIVKGMVTLKGGMG
jgi:hypothetical protein